jgi:hypothetical protein
MKFSEYKDKYKKYDLLLIKYKEDSTLLSTKNKEEFHLCWGIFKSPNRFVSPDIDKEFLSTTLITTDNEGFYKDYGDRLINEKEIEDIQILPINRLLFFVDLKSFRIKDALKKRLGDHDANI